jgi:hypothetical protein
MNFVTEAQASRFFLMDTLCGSMFCGQRYVHKHQASRKLIETVSLSFHSDLVKATENTSGNQAGTSKLLKVDPAGAFGCLMRHDESVEAIINSRKKRRRCGEVINASSSWRALHCISSFRGALREVEAKSATGTRNEGAIKRLREPVAAAYGAEHTEL